MTPERWKRIEELYHAARARPAAERAAFLANACSDDEAMRRNVESLLAASESDDGFLAEPALPTGPDVILLSLILHDWDEPTNRPLLAKCHAALPAGGWPNWVLGNHDQPRIASRIGREQARIAAMLLLTLRGTPTLYNGDEIGMVNGAIRPAQVIALDLIGRVDRCVNGIIRIGRGRPGEITLSEALSRIEEARRW